MICSYNSKAKLRCKVDAEQRILMVDAVLQLELMEATETRQLTATTAEQRAVEYQSTASGVISN